MAAWYVTYLLCLWDVETIVLIVPPGGESFEEGVPGDGALVKGDEFRAGIASLASQASDDIQVISLIATFIFKLSS